MVPKALRDALGLVPRTTLDVTAYGEGLTLIPRRRAARVVEENGHLVLATDKGITDEELFGLIDASRR